MAELQWALTCRDVIVAQGSNAATYRDSIEQLEVSELPSILPSIFVISTLWRREDYQTPESLRVRVVAESSNQDVLGETEPTSVDLEGNHLYRAHIPNPKIPISEEGVVNFIVQKETEEGWESVKELPVRISEVSSTVENLGANVIDS